MIEGKILLIIWVILMIYILLRLFLDGKKALLIFPDIKSVEVIFRERTASGHSTKNWHSKIGGATNSLDIIVTDKELWIKSMVLGAGVLKRFDLLHKIPLQNIINTNKKGKMITVDFKTIDEEKRQVILRIKYPDKFLIAINKYNSLDNKVNLNL